MRVYKHKSCKNAIDSETLEFKSHLAHQKENGYPKGYPFSFSFFVGKFIDLSLHLLGYRLRSILLLDTAFLSDYWARFCSFLARSLVSMELRNTTNRWNRYSSTKFRTILMAVTRYSFHSRVSTR